VVAGGPAITVSIVLLQVHRRLIVKGQDADTSILNLQMRAWCVSVCFILLDQAWSDVDRRDCCHEMVRPVSELRLHYMQMSVMEVMA
jgi:hypothetical protein